MPHTKILLQARMSSTRLPGKSLLTIAGVPLAILCAKRLGRGKIPLLLCTSTDPSDDVLAREAERAGVAVYRGELDDTLQRFIDATRSMNPEDVIIRATADNPFPDAAFASRVLSLFLERAHDYIGPGYPDSGMPYGLCLEAFRVGVLRRVNTIARAKEHREHVTPLMMSPPFSATTYLPEDFNISHSAHIRCTVDTFDDYLRIASVFGVFHNRPPESVPWQELLDALCKYSETPKFNVPQVGSGFPRDSRLAIGTANFGQPYGARQTQVRARDAERLLKTAIDHGVNWIDTARAYGRAENIIGESLIGGWRDRVKICTKLAPTVGLDEFCGIRHLESEITASVNASLRALRTDYVEVLLLHRAEQLTAHGGLLVDLLHETKDRYGIKDIGVSVYTPEEAVLALKDPRIKHLQLPFNVLDKRWTSSEFMHWVSVRRDVRIHARSVFIQGTLLADPSEWANRLPGSARAIHQILEKLRALAKNQSMASFCLAYALSQNWINTVVIGCDSMEQLMENMTVAANCSTWGHVAKLVESVEGISPSPFWLDPRTWR